jgi:hypothetical protein
MCAIRHAFRRDGQAVDEPVDGVLLLDDAVDKFKVCRRQRRGADVLARFVLEKRGLVLFVATHTQAEEGGERERERERESVSLSARSTQKWQTATREVHAANQPRHELPRIE